MCAPKIAGDANNILNYCRQQGTASNRLKAELLISEIKLMHVRLKQYLIKII